MLESVWMEPRLQEIVTLLLLIGLILQGCVESALELVREWRQRRRLNP
jgi:hypothetical protein